MAHYENGKDTKKRILQAAKKLFFEKGYQETTFSDICRTAHVNQGSIYYHFKEKHTLLTLVGEEINENNRAIARNLLPEGMPPVYVLLLDIYIYWYRFFYDSAFHRFMCEPSPTPCDDFGEYLSFWRGLAPLVPDIDSFIKEHTLDLIVCNGIDRILGVYAQEYPNRYTWQQFATYQIRTIASILHLEQDTINHMIEQTDQIVTSPAFLATMQAMGESGQEF